MDHLPEVLLQHGQEVVFGAALEGLGEEVTALGQRFDGEMRRDFAKMHRAQVIRSLVARGRRGHVGDHEIGRAVERRAQERWRRVVEKVHLEELDAGNGRHLKKVDRGNADVGIRRIGHLGGDLRPASRRRAKIDDPACAVTATELLSDGFLVLLLFKLKFRALYKV